MGVPVSRDIFIIGFTYLVSSLFYHYLQLCRSRPRNDYYVYGGTLNPTCYSCVVARQRTWMLLTVFWPITVVKHLCTGFLLAVFHAINR